MKVPILHSMLKNDFQTLILTKRVIVWISIVVCLLLLIPPSQRVATYLHSPTKSEKIGSFFIANTTEQKVLDIYLPLSNIGVTYNFTITVHSNSSSGIIVSILHVHVREGPIWEGPSELRLEPDRTVTVCYISHFVSWCGTDSDTYFHYGLLESSKNASGTYQLVIVHPGYPVGKSIPFTFMFLILHFGQNDNREFMGHLS
jgi:hypothetical protein